MHNARDITYIYTSDHRIDIWCKAIYWGHYGGREYNMNLETSNIRVANARKYISWWHHEMETFSASLAICAGNSPITGEFPTQRSLTRSFDVFFHLRLNKRLSKQWWGWWFEMPSRPLWRHSNAWVANAWRYTCLLYNLHIAMVPNKRYCASNHRHLDFCSTTIQANNKVNIEDLNH